MRVIMTHEQADFDALAAQLGAYLLNEHAVPVLPRRMNRNARAFVTMYGAELPFTEVTYLPNETIEELILVDAQSMVTLKGMSGKTRVHVIDHHPRRDDLPDDWLVNIYSLGAITTQFVEELNERNGHLSMIHATLLLLGIYEDTGSLTYVSTTPRDVRAAAFLLEQGASLHIANDYLNPPLSEEQRRAYDNLLSSAETLTINGQKVIVSQANLGHMSEEISSVAHKLRDVLDPDALFLLVQTNEGVRLVARSTTDRINVANVAAHFNGGGHDRAAGALVRQEAGDQSQGQSPLLAVYRELIDILPGYIQPPIPVRQIMSPQPMVLSPSTPAVEAAHLMQRYGYEGYPVVKDGQVIGLLTRRAVDRALAHKLNLTAGSLMEAGAIHISPHAAIDDVQRIMSSTGWGQVPVTDPETGEVVGIVTRTDLLKTLAGRPGSVSERKNIADRLENTLPPAHLALLKAVASRAHDLRQAVYIVGGFVRDLVLNRPSQDFDVVIEGDAITLARSLTQTYGGRTVTHSRFGTAKWQIDDTREELAGKLTEELLFEPQSLPASLDLISARTEFYEHPSALPTVERGSIKLDLHRRDFTINTLALRLDGRHYGELYDFWGGLNDLQKGLVRVLHSLSFIDDPTRILRAVRFEQRFDFAIEERTLQLMNEAKDMLSQVSGERLRHELDLILTESRADTILARLEELGLLEAIHPGLHWHTELAPALKSILLEPIEPDWDLPGETFGQPTRRILGYLIWLLRLPEDTLRAIGYRLRFSSNLQDALLMASRLWHKKDDLIDASPSQVYDALHSSPPAVLYAVHQLAPAQNIRDIIEYYMFRLRQIEIDTDGNRLMQHGVKPGPIYRVILETLKKARLDGEIHSSEEEEALLMRLLHSLNQVR